MFYSRFLRVLLILPFVRASLCVSSVSEGRGVTDDCVRVCHTDSVSLDYHRLPSAH